MATETLTSYPGTNPAAEPAHDTGPKVQCVVPGWWSGRGMMVWFGRFLGPTREGWGGSRRVPSDDPGFQTGKRLNLCMAWLLRITVIYRRSVGDSVGD